MVAACICLCSGLLFVNLYTSIVDARSWAADMPGSIATARAYYAHTNPGDFFRMFAPMLQVSSLLLLIACWKGPGLRGLAIAVLLISLCADALTFGYFYPRNEIIFMSDAGDAAIRTAVEEWSAMNWVRSLVVAVGVGVLFVLQNRIFKLDKTRS